MRETPRELGLPGKFKFWREGQLEAIDAIYSSDKPVYLLDSPTGSGKSLIGIGSYSKIALTRHVLDTLGDKEQARYRCLYITKTKQLQDQVCIGLETNILRSDLWWVKAKTLHVGDKLIGFDEYTLGGGNRRLWRNSVIEGIQVVERPSYRLTFDDGTEIISSEDHLWLITSGQKRGQAVSRWVKTANLRDAGSGLYASKVSRLLPVWECKQDWVSGYLAAAFDGEGCLVQKPAVRARGMAVDLSFSQSENGMLSTVESLLKQRGFENRRYTRESLKPNWHKNIILQIRSRPQVLRFLGEIRPKRLLEKFDPDKMGSIFNYGRATLVKKEFLGAQPVIAIQTSTKTFVAEGLASHNCRDFPKARTIKGRSNYRCNMFPDKFPEVTAEDCQGKDKCNKPCDYARAKLDAVRAPVAVLNDSYFLAEANGPGEFSDADLVVLDEIDSMESVLMNHIQMSITESQLKRLQIKAPPKNSRSTMREWLIWAETARREADRGLENLGRSLPLMPEWSDVEIKLNRQMKRLQAFRNKLEMFAADVNDSWIFSYEDDESGWRATFRPVLVAEYAHRYLWRHGKRFLGMSGTIFDAGILAKDLGIESWDYSRMDSLFPVENRPIFYTPLVNLSFKRMAVELPRLATAIDTILNEYSDSRVLIHTVSYHIRDYLMQNLPGERLMTHNSDDREEKLQEFKTSPEPRVMVSPSFDRGVDLPNEACRCVIICKIPYLNLSDSQVKARMALSDGQRWYSLKAAQSVVQMSGRAVRAEDDYCATYILDRQFANLLARTRHIIPGWWQDAIRVGGLS